jgi:hypothetical protein
MAMDMVAPEYGKSYIKRVFQEFETKKRITGWRFKYSFIDAVSTDTWPQR